MTLRRTMAILIYGLAGSAQAMTTAEPLLIADTETKALEAHDSLLEDSSSGWYEDLKPMVSRQQHFTFDNPSQMPDIFICEGLWPWKKVLMHNSANVKLRTPPLEAHEAVAMSLQMEAQGGEVAFDLGLFGAAGTGVLEFWLNGVQVLKLDQPTAEQRYSFALPADGLVTLRWVYMKQRTDMPLDEFARLDNLSIYGSMDMDQDGLNDAWEYKHWGDLSAQAGADLDNDGLNNLQEMKHHTNPMLADSDEDAALDGWEVRQGFDPNQYDAESINLMLQQFGENYFSMGMHFLAINQADKAYSFFLKASEHGHQNSMLEMANLFASGTGVAQDQVLADFWIQAHSQLDAQSYFQLAKDFRALHAPLTSHQQDAVQLLLKRAASLQHTGAMNALTTLHWQ